MKNTKETSEMTVVELKELAKSLKIENAGTSKKELQLSIAKWEKAQLKARNAGDMKKLGEVTGTEVIETVSSKVIASVDTFQGKKVISRTPRTLNGVKYEDILVERGITYSEEVK